MTGPEGYEAPLSVERDGRNSGWWQALDERAGLEAGWPGQGSQARAQPLVAFPREALAVLQQVQAGHAHRLLRRCITQLQHQHLGGWVGSQLGGQGAPTRASDTSAKVLLGASGEHPLNKH